MTDAGDDPVADPTLRQGEWAPGRVFAALGRIGYEPVSAILDIVDNSVSANANRVTVSMDIERVPAEGPGRPRTFVSAIQIADNGTGMNETQIVQALTLGSPDTDYTPGTLAKFGFGLKAASASLGGLLSILTKGSDGTLLQVLVDFDEIQRLGEYVYRLQAAGPELTTAFSEQLGDASGTIIRIERTHTEQLPSPAEIERRLKTLTGTTYYFKILDPQHPIEIVIQGESVAAIDPLFEAEVAGDLDETDWDGVSVRYIQRPIDIQLSTDGAVLARVTITQLPHPPTVEHALETSRQATRKKYRIEAGNYGFFIYRNGRLISEATRLGLVPRGQSLYSFRARIEIGDSADDVLNLDVAKSRIHLSDVARLQLSEIAKESVKKSREAWTAATKNLRQLLAESVHEAINEELDVLASDDERGDTLDEEAAPEAERVALAARRASTTSRSAASESESEELRDRSARVQHVAMLSNNQVWQRGHDPARGLFVRINTAHRLFDELLRDYDEDSVLQPVLDLLFFTLARAEYEMVYRSGLAEEQVMEAVMEEFRERFGSALSENVRRIDAEAIFGDDDDDAE